MPDPPYITDAERPLRPIEMRDRFRFYVCFRWRGVQYTRWFPRPSDIPGYIANFPGAQVMNQGESRTHAEAEREAALLREASRA